jgi:hypothetical protein
MTKQHCRNVSHSIAACGNAYMSLRYIPSNWISLTALRRNVDRILGELAVYPKSLDWSPWIGGGIWIASWES